MTLRRTPVRLIKQKTVHAFDLGGDHAGAAAQRAASPANTLCADAHGQKFSATSCRQLGVGVAGSCCAASSNDSTAGRRGLCVVAGAQLGLSARDVRAVHRVAAHVQQLGVRVQHAVQDVQHWRGAVCGGVTLAFHAARLRVPSRSARVERQHAPGRAASAEGRFAVFVHQRRARARVAAGRVHWPGVLGPEHCDVAEQRAPVYTRIRRHPARVRWERHAR